VGYELYPLARHLADTGFTVTEGEASPRNGLGNPVRHDPYRSHGHYTVVAGTTCNKAPSTTSHVEILQPTRIVFASGTRVKTHFPGYVDMETRAGRVTTPGHTRQVVIIDVSITFLA